MFINKWFDKLSNKKRRIIGFSIIGGTIGYFLTSTLMIIPGMGIESLTFINSVEKQINRIMPKGKYVLDPESPMYDLAIEASLKPLFKAEALSTLDYDDEYDQKLIPYYELYADNWFQSHWQPKVDAREEIDLNDVGLNFIEFDKSIATQFGGYGFVNTGISYAFYNGKKNKLYSKEVKDFAIRQQTVLDQEVYESYLDYRLSPISGLSLNYSIGSYIVNNKVWFLNQNVKALERILGLPVTPFKDKTLKASETSKEVTIKDLKAPNFIATLYVLRIGFVIFWFNIITIPLGSYIAYKALHGTVKQAKVKKEKQPKISKGEE